MSTEKWANRYNPRTLFGDTLIRLARNRGECIALSADLVHGCGIGGFNDVLPGRCINVGVAEQNMAGIAAGLATEGKIPWMVTIAPFITMRCLEQIRTDICYNNLHVVIVSTFAGLSGAPLGATHYGLEDIGIFRSLANMTIMQPADAWETERAMEIAMDLPGPVYVRIGGGSEPSLDADRDQFTLGKALRLTDGKDVAIHATGYMVHKALDAADVLLQKGVSVAVYDHHTIRPLDAGAVLATAKPGKLLVSLEEHYAFGGLGSAVAEVLAEAGTSARLVRLGIPDVYGGVGEREALLSKYNLDVESVVARVEEALTRTQR